jgi:aspartate aminotransferase
MQLSSLANRLIGQPMFALLSKAKELEKQGKRIIHMEIGDSNFPTPQFIIEETKKALDEGYTHYCPSMGLYELRETICEYTYKDLGFRPDIDQVLIAPANAIIDFVVRCICDKDDSIVYPDPGFPTYLSVILYNNLIGIFYNGASQEIDLEQFNYLIKVLFGKLLIINSPSNPIGDTLEQKFVQSLFDLAQKNNIFILSDEVYSKIIYEGQHFSPCIYDQCKERVILLQSFSKLYSMSGFRLGYCIGPKELIKKMSLLLETIISCIPPFIQKAGAELLKLDSDNYWRRHWIGKKVYELKTRKDLLVNGLNKIPGFKCSMPKGAFYAWCNIKDSGLNDLQLADLLLNKANIACLPGRYFGSEGAGYLRFCFASVSLGEIEEALERIRLTLLI